MHFYILIGVDAPRLHVHVDSPLHIIVFYVRYTCLRSSGPPIVGSNAACDFNVVAANTGDLNVRSANFFLILPAKDNCPFSLVRFVTWLYLLNKFLQIVRHGVGSYFDTLELLVIRTGAASAQQQQRA